MSALWSRHLLGALWPCSSLTLMTTCRWTHSYSTPTPHNTCHNPGKLRLAQSRSAASVSMHRVETATPGFSTVNVCLNITSNSPRDRIPKRQTILMGNQVLTSDVWPRQKVPNGNDPLVTIRDATFLQMRKNALSHRVGTEEIFLPHS